jgi:hypothetical protein
LDEAFGLKPGAYRVEAALTGWDEEKFTEAERSELARMGSLFMTGEVPDSIRITLTPSAKYTGTTGADTRSTATGKYAVILTLPFSWNLPSRTILPNIRTARSLFPTVPLENLEMFERMGAIFLS